MNEDTDKIIRDLVVAASHCLPHLPPGLPTYATEALELAVRNGRAVRDAYWRAKDIAALRTLVDLDNPEDSP